MSPVGFNLPEFVVDVGGAEILGGYQVTPMNPVGDVEEVPVFSHVLAEGHVRIEQAVVEARPVPTLLNTLGPNKLECLTWANISHNTRHNDIQDNDTQHNDIKLKHTQHNDTHQNDTQHNNICQMTQHSA